MAVKKANDTTAAVVLIYIGTTDYVPAVPARDLTAQDIAELALAQNETSAVLTKRLIESGLYRAPQQEA